jgi:hypothetical protein
MKKIFTLLLCLFALAAAAQTSQVTYQESEADFPNPERGFYRYSSTYANPYAHLNVDIMKGYRQLHKPSSANYQIYSTLVFRYFFLKDFVDSPISQDFLDNMASDFAAAREAGVKIIVRFAYTEDVNDEGCSSWICPPYGDASKERVLEHIGQLKPVLQANKDAIAVVQFGFIGVWGEGYYTDYFGDASQFPHYLNEQNWADRGEALAALLDAVPLERQVQVRYPQIKQKLIYGVNAPTDSAPLTLAEAHDGSNKSRIGHHNDCFLASSTDFGTYNNYGPGSSNSDTLRLKPYKAADSRFVAVGGETCSKYSPTDDCQSAGGKADLEMRRFHYSYLNSQYNNPAVNNDWVTQGCIEDIKRELGYRFVLREGEYSDEARPGDAISVEVQLENLGYAAPFNPRDVEFILRDKTQELTYRVKIADADPRFWESGSMHVTQANPCLPADIPPGNYDLLLNLPDPEPSIHNRAEFAIRVANQGVWESVTGYNSLLHVVEVKPDAATNPCSGGPVFEQIDYVNSTSDNHWEFQPEWMVFPNPAKGYLSVACENPDIQLLSASMTDLFGRTVTQQFERRGGGMFSMEIPGVVPGAYFLRLETKGGVWVERVMVQ